MSEETLKLVAMIFGALFAVSEVVAMSPLKSNSVFQLVFNFLKGAVEFFKKKEEPKA